MQKANILLIHCDQLRFDCLGVNGHPLVRTPNLDRLASEGANFSHAFTPAPICSPARASLLTGLWSFQHGCISTPGNEIYRPAYKETPVFSTYLKDAGYQLGWVGKFHSEVIGNPTDWGFDDFISERAYGDWRAELGLPPKPQVNRWFGETDAGITAEQSRLAWGADTALSLLDRYRADGRPFFLRWDPSEPHLPNVVPEPYASMYKPSDIEPWPSFYDELNDKPYIQGQQKRTWGLDTWAWKDWAPIVARYLGEVTLLDAQVGRLLDRLDESELTESTLVLFSNDHGDLCGGHGQIDKHFVMYDDITRVPLIARFPGRIAPRTECDAFVSHEIDMASTIFHAAGLEPPDTFQGRSLIDIAGGKDPDPRADIFSAWHGAQLGAFTQRMVRDRAWKYVWNATAVDELYDMAGDPAELRNLAQNPDYSAELSRLRARLISWMELLKDPILNEWTRGALESGTKL